MGKALGEFISVRYEQAHEHAKTVIAKFNVQAFPTLLVLGPDGAEWDEVGAGDPASFVKDLARIRTGTDTLPALREKVASNPDDTRAALDLADKLSNRYPQETIAICKRLMPAAEGDDEETRARILFLHGYAESNRGGNAVALDLWERVLTEFPKTRAAGHATMLATNVVSDLPPERGLAFLAKALKLADEDTRVHLEYTRGYLYLKAAEAEWLRRGEEAGDEPEMLNMLAWECFQRGWHTQQAIGWARKAVKLSERAPHILDTLANLLFKSGAIDEAIRLEEEAMAKVEDPAMRADFEENLLMWNAVRAIRAIRASEDATKKEAAKQEAR